MVPEQKANNQDLKLDKLSALEKSLDHKRKKIKERKRRKFFWQTYRKKKIKNSGRVILVLTLTTPLLQRYTDSFPSICHKTSIGDSFQTLFFLHLKRFLHLMTKELFLEQIITQTIPKKEARSKDIGQPHNWPECDWLAPHSACISNIN